MPRARPILSPLGARLALAFVAVALGALALLSALMVVVASHDVSDLARKDRQQAAAAIATAASSAYEAAGAWGGADLDAVRGLAGEHGATVALYDESGQAVGQVATPPRAALVERQPVDVAGRRVGTVRVAFARPGLSAAERHLRDGLVGAVALGAGGAALLALGTAVLVARRITRPIAALTRAAGAVERGERSTRVGDLSAPGELGDLAVAFDRMAASVDRQEDLRRNLLVDVAHELRTPLTILRGSLEAMTDGVVEPTPTALASAHDEVLRLTSRVEDLEAMARADAAGLRLDVRPIDLAEVAREATVRLERHFLSGDIEVVTRFDTAPVNGDPERLRQVATNLLTNALKFTPADGRVTVETGTDGGESWLRVSDTGTGIAPDDVPHVFDRFWRGANAEAVAGSGVGLAVVAAVVDAHHGRVSVEPGPSGGTVAEVRLPAR